MRYLLNTDAIQFEVSKTAVAKLDDKGVQKIDAMTKLPVWAVQLTGWTNEEDGTEVIPVSVVSATVPNLQWRQPVEVVDLEMLPWTQKRRDGEIRSGVAFRARAIRPVGYSDQQAA